MIPSFSSLLFLRNLPSSPSHASPALARHWLLTIDVSVMPLVGLVLDVSGGDGDSSSLLLRSLVDLRVVNELGGSGLGGEMLATGVQRNEKFKGQRREGEEGRGRQTYVMAAVRVVFP